MRWLFNALVGKRCRRPRVFRYMEAVHCCRFAEHPGEHYFAWRRDD